MKLRESSYYQDILFGTAHAIERAESSQKACEDYYQGKFRNVFEFPGAKRTLH